MAALLDPLGQPKYIKMQSTGVYAGGYLAVPEWEYREQIGTKTVIYDLNPKRRYKDSGYGFFPKTLEPVKEKSDLYRVMDVRLYPTAELASAAYRAGNLSNDDKSNLRPLEKDLLGGWIPPYVVKRLQRGQDPFQSDPSVLTRVGRTLLQRRHSR